MSWDEPTQDELDDAILEDTCHCDLCGGSFVLGSSPDYVIVDNGISTGGFGRLGGQLKLCIHCAGKVHDGYREALSSAGICEHGLPDTEHCEDCQKEYKRARKENGIDDDAST